MSGRSLAELTMVGVRRVHGLAGKEGGMAERAGVESVADLLQHFPHRYIDRTRVVPFREVLAGTAPGEEVTVIGTVKEMKTRYVRRNLTIFEATVYDGESYLWATWFNQKWRPKQLPPGTDVALSGKVERKRARLQMSNPDVDVLDRRDDSLVTGRIVPVHPSLGKLGPNKVRRYVHNALKRSQPIGDPLPPATVERLGIVARDRAFAGIHFPDDMAEVAAARRRLVFDELFRLEVALALRKHRQIQEAKGIAHVIGDGLVEEFVRSLPYPLTGAQRRVIAEIEGDLGAPHPMHRLLQGEVGSGKTVVAVAALLVAVQGRHQGAVMAPTEVLATQHYLNMADLIGTAGMTPPLEDEGARLGMAGLFEQAAPHHPIRLALLTSNAAEVNFRPPGATRRADLVEWIAGGNVDLVVGTHALIQEGVDFHRLGVAVVDEQHRFGVHQRVQLRDKGAERDPDLLIMTATPIPRTLSMTLYGDLDVSLLDEMPPGRSPVATSHLGKGPAGEEHWIDLVRSEVAGGRQAFVVCPLVEDSPKIELASATAEFERLAAVLAPLRVDLLHGQMRPVEKDAVMHRMRAGEIDVLVATTVIEVGIDIPNATVMVIEDADRFGLSQLHQLRGRVGRGSHAATCVLVADPATPEGEQRIAAMVATTDGFRLAEEDLRIRGQGTVFGARQAGMPDLRLADILTDAELLITARREAFALVAADSDLSEHPGVADDVRHLLGGAVDWLFVS